MDLIMKGIRWVLWLICKGCFFLMDSIFNIIQPIVTFDIGTSDTLWAWWSGLILFITFFIFIRIFSMFMKAGMDEEYRLRSDPVKIIVRIGAVATVILFLPISIKYFTSVSATMIDHMEGLFETEDSFVYDRPYTDNEFVNEQLDQLYEAYDGMPSQLIVSAASNGKYPPYQLIDINDTEGGVDSWFDGVPVIGGFFDITSGLIGADGDFVYFADTTMLIFLIVEAICAAYLFVMMAIQISQRIFNIGLKILISPYPISGLVNPEDRSFSLWARLLAADLLSNVIQYLLLLFVLAITSMPAVQNMGLVAQGIFFLGGMLAVIVGPNSIAQIIGGDGMGTFQTMQAIQTISTMKGMTTGAIAGAGAFAGAAIATGAYGAGRALGGRSLGQGLGAAAAAAATAAGRWGSNPFTSGGGSGPGSGSGGGGSSSAAYEEPTEGQRKAAEKRGIDINGMNRGQASQALQDAGMSRSYWDGMDVSPRSAGDARGTIADNAGNYSQGNHGTYAFQDDGAAYTSSSGSSNESNTGAAGATQATGDNNNGQDEAPRLTREGSFARRIADGNSFSSRMASSVGRAMYISSGNRIMGNKTYARGGRTITRNTRMQTLSNIKAGIQEARRPTTGSNDTNTTGSNSGSSQQQWDPYKADKEAMKKGMHEE